MSLAAVPRLDSAEHRKARGAFFTPDKVAEYVTRWAVRNADDAVLEPSCGEAAFLLQAARRLQSLGGEAQGSQLVGVELHEESARKAEERVEQAGATARVLVSDFFLVDPEARFDAVVGNPPYIRYQDFSGESRRKSREAALRAGVNLTALASSWAAFTVHSALFLKRGGRMGLVLPAELLSVNYAGPIRRFLMEQFAEVNVVMFEERVFPGVQEEVVLLLAEGYRMGPAAHASVFQLRGPGDLDDQMIGYRWTPPSLDSKWTPSMLSSAAHAAYSISLAGRVFTTLQEWGDTTLGMVTGNNRYFALSSAKAQGLGLSSSDLIRLSPPGSKHLRGLELTTQSLNEMDRNGTATFLFRPGLRPSAAARRYIASGEVSEVHLAYKCRVRDPWWRVPLVRPADLFLTYMNSDTPRITSNTAKVHHLNSVHGIYLRPDLTELGRDVLPVAALNSVTLLGAEIVGRSYGGGMLKIEPREADDLPMPAPHVVDSARRELQAVKKKVMVLLGRSDLVGASTIVDEVLVRNGFDADAALLTDLRHARASLASRRLARGTEPKEH